MGDTTEVDRDPFDVAGHYLAQLDSQALDAVGQHCYELMQGSVGDLQGFWSGVFAAVLDARGEASRPAADVVTPTLDADEEPGLRETMAAAAPKCSGELRDTAIGAEEIATALAALEVSLATTDDREYRTRVVRARRQLRKLARTADTARRAIDALR